MSPAAAFSFHAVTKIFGTLRANDEVSFSVAAESIHGVVGENGAGKSTIMKTLYGMYPPDSGEMRVHDKPVKFRSPEEAIRLGIGMVHQHFMLVPTLAVWQNIILGQEPHAWLPNKRKCLAAIGDLQTSFGFSLDLEAIVGDLSVGLQQQVEILKLLYRKAQILIFDEPTAVLTPQEVTVLITRLQGLRKQGKTIVFISHKLREILALTDSVTVLRQGKVVGTFNTKDLTETALAEKMIGRKMQILPARKGTQPSPLLEVKNLVLEGPHCRLLDDVSFQVRSGEIVGVAGIDGNGQQELIEILAKARTDYQGSVQWEGKDFSSLKPYPLKQSGLAVIAPDRHKEACILDFDLGENWILGHHYDPRAQTRGRIRWNRVYDLTRQTIERFDVRPANCQARMGGLSGGNQQKLVIGRELAHPVRLLLAAHPTRGVDIGAIERIHKEILSLRDGGSGVLLFSSELDEILALADRILVIYNGRIQGSFPRAEATESRLGLCMTGGSA